MNQLTNQEKAKVLGMYLGCEVIAPHPLKADDKEMLAGFLTGVSGESHAEIQLIEDGSAWEDPEYFDYEFVKMVLMPLSGITDEHAVMVGNIVNNVFAIHDDEKRELGRWEVVGKSRHLQSPEIYMYLLGQGYAMPLFFTPNHWANGKTAIELGIAIYKNEKRGA